MYKYKCKYKIQLQIIYKKTKLQNSSGSYFQSSKPVTSDSHIQIHLHHKNTNKYNAKYYWVNLWYGSQGNTERDF